MLLLATSSTFPPNAYSEVLPNGLLVWSSNRNDGRHEIYLKDLKAQTTIRLTKDSGRFPLWSPDGKWIAYFNFNGRATYIIRPDGSEEKKICDGLPVHWSNRTGQLLCGIPEEWVGYNDQWYTKKDVRFYSCTVSLESCVYLYKKSDFLHLKDQALWPGGVTADGRYMVGWVWGLFNEGYTADNGTFTSGHSSVILDLEDKTKIYFFGSGCLTAVSPVGDWIYQVSRESDSMPDIFRMNIKDKMTRSSYQVEIGNRDEDWGHEYMPSISNDNQWMVYVASTGCHEWYACDYDIFLHRLGADKSQRELLIRDPASDIFPSLFIRSTVKPLSDGGSGADSGIAAQADAGEPLRSDSSGCMMASFSRPMEQRFFAMGSILLLVLILMRRRHANLR